MSRPTFALLFERTYLERWHLACLEMLERSATLACTLSVDHHLITPERRAKARLSRMLSGPSGALRRVAVAERLANVPTITAGHPSGSVVVDFVLRLGRAPIAPGLAIGARYGVWCFEHELVGGPLPFFDEVFDGTDVTRAALLAYGVGADDPEVLEEGWFRTERRSYAQNTERVLASVAPWPSRVCKRVLHRCDGTRAAGTHTRALATRPHHRLPFLRLSARIMMRRLRFAWERLFRHSQWNIGLIPFPAAALLRPGNYRDDCIVWFPLKDRKRFLADPFGIVRDGKIQVFCEEFEYASGRGRISTLEYSDGGFCGLPDPVIEHGVHMSYPCVVQDGREIYCVPETSQAGEVVLYRAVDFPRVWTRAATLVPGFAGVDPTVFSHGGRWWLMCTERGREEDSSLWIWHAPALHGPWAPHARNPVKTDVRGTRPGGAPFAHDGVLYRPTQDCSKRYGWRVVIQRVLVLTPTEFAEEPASVVEPSGRTPWAQGRHTLTPVGNVVLVDGHRRMWGWAAFQAFLRIWARDLARRLHPGGRES